MMPEWVWIPIVVVVVVVVALLIKRGGKIKGAGIEIDLSARKPDETPHITGCNNDQRNKLRVLENNLTTMYGELGAVIRHFLKQVLHVPEAGLSNNNDFLLADALAWQVIYGKNGKHSVRTIIEDRIEYEDYRIDESLPETARIGERRKYMRSLIKQIMGEVMRTYNDKYDNLYTIFDPLSGEVTKVDRLLTIEAIVGIVDTYVHGSLADIVESMLYGSALGGE